MCKYFGTERVFETVYAWSSQGPGASAQVSRREGCFRAGWWSAAWQERRLESRGCSCCWSMCGGSEKHSSFKCAPAKQAPSRGWLTWPKISGAGSPGEQVHFWFHWYLRKKKVRFTYSIRQVALYQIQWYTNFVNPYQGNRTWTCLY
jgi:hypothetical protein